MTCDVALPVFAGEFLTAVMVLFCGDEKPLAPSNSSTTIRKSLTKWDVSTVTMAPPTCSNLIQGTRSFPRGFGLPGRTWKAGMPLIIKDLHNSKRFLRWEEASEIGMSCGVGVPYKTLPIRPGSRRFYQHRRRR